MPVPDYQSLMRPVLAALAGGEPCRSEVLRERLAGDLGLTQDDLSEMLRSGATVFTNRVAWALSYLYKTGLLDRPARGVYAITARGQQVLSDNPERVDLGVLRQFPEYAALDPQTRKSSRTTRSASSDAAKEDRTPDELIVDAYERLRATTADDLMIRVLAASPAFFERVVLDVLTAMGYGGSRIEAARHLGRSGDEGVDGVIHEDRLGLDVIYVQAKRYARDRTVGRPDVQSFVGALQGQRASKGVLMTTAQFSGDAVRYAETITPRVVLVDGRELADLMIDYGVGVAVREAYHVHRVDADYFIEDSDNP